MTTPDNTNSGAVLESVTIGGVRLPAASDFELSLESIERVSNLIDLVEETEAADVIVSTISCSEPANER